MLNWFSENILLRQRNALLIFHQHETIQNGDKIDSFYKNKFIVWILLLIYKQFFRHYQNKINLISSATFWNEDIFTLSLKVLYS